MRFPSPLLCLTALLPALSFPAGQAAAPARTAKAPLVRPVVTARYPHDLTAFTQGLQYLGGGLLLESTGQVGKSGVRRVELRTGKVVQSVPTPISTAFGEGATLLDGVIYHLTWQEGVAFALDGKSMREVGRFKYRGEGWGITNDGKALITSDGSSALSWRDPKTFAVTKTVNVTDDGQPVKNLNELEFVQGFVYANVWLTPRVAKIDPKTGAVTAWIDLTPLAREAAATALRKGVKPTFDDVPNGIAFIPERGTMLLGGKNWPTLFEVRLPGLKVESGATARPPLPRTRS